MYITMTNMIVELYSSQSCIPCILPYDQMKIDHIKAEEIIFHRISSQFICQNSINLSDENN
ncbi:hypothetical protein DERF_001670 [Dermatophagoides farinae]|uniref:Uncharacterized protein n=1 Tax=Dermatophagoides farinae TaxID=6954 RepID=A0A922L9V7_DERFA|nr:hypothetical protein DERF_001670 [Dermatophagoides farinae]